MLLYIRILAPFLVFFMSSAATGSFALADAIKDTDGNRIAAKVNARPILVSQLKPAIDIAQAKFKKYGTLEMPDETRNRIQLEELDRQIGFELLMQAGEKIYGKEIDKKVDEKINAKQANDSKGEKPRKAVEKNLKNDSYRNQLRRQLLVDEYLAIQVNKDLKVPEAELKKYYEQNAKNFTESESVRVSHILIKIPPKSTPEDIARLKKEIELIRTEIAGGKEFAEMAKQRSACSSSPAGGDLGYIKHNYMPQEFEKVAFALKTGETSEVVRTQHGFHLIRAFDKKPERVPEFAEMKDFIDKFMLKNLQRKRAEEAISGLKREAKVEIFLK